MRSYGSTTRGGSWSGAHVPLPAAPVVHQRPHITQLEHAADLGIPPRNVSRLLRDQGLTPHEGRGKNPPRKAAQ
jgi:hypothetical protein